MKSLWKNPAKAILQWGTLIAIIVFLTKIFGNETADPEAYCPLGGIETLGSYLVNGSLACSMTMTQIMMGVALAVGIILFSKLFCGYICPLGTIGEYTARLRKKLKIKTFEIKSKSIADKILRSFKYILLFIIFYYTISSSELFCKNFDPYYAFATGFQGELTLWMAIAAIAVFFIGNFVVDMFWCKYICPLGALSNVFKFTISFVILIGLYAAANLSGLAISWVYILGAVCITGFILEIVYHETNIFPILKIKKDKELCNDCGLCTKKCPYGIDVCKTDTVKDIDCTLCGECITACNKSALTISGKKSLRWLPAILTVVMFALALYLGSVYELPTIDEKWGDKTKHDKLEKLQVEGLRSVKCFGSSKAFSAQLQKIPGVYGVATYVKHQNVEIYYNPAEIAPEKIRELIYTPAKFRIANPPAEEKQVKVVTIRTENMFDKMDPNYLGMQFRLSKKGYYGLETEYACPLIVRLYMNINEPIDADFIKNTVEMKELQMPVHGGGVKKVEVDFKFISIEEKVDTISKREFLERQFHFYKKQYESNVEKYAGKKEAVYEIVYTDLDKPLIIRNIPYLSSHLSLQEGFLGIETALNDNDLPVFRIKYSQEVLNDDKIWKALTKTKWTVKTKEGEIQVVEPKFTFSEPGATLKTNK